MTDKLDDVRRSVMLTTQMHAMVTNKAAAHKVTADDVIEALFEVADHKVLNAALDKLSTERRRTKEETKKRRKALAEVADNLSPEDFAAIMKMISDRT